MRVTNPIIAIVVGSLAICAIVIGLTYDDRSSSAAECKICSAGYYASTPRAASCDDCAVGNLLDMLDITDDILALADDEGPTLGASINEPSPLMYLNRTSQARPNGLAIAYEVIGNSALLTDSTAPLFVFTPWGQNNRKKMLPFARAINTAFSNTAVGIVWDRRNMGMSSAAYHGTSLADKQVADLEALVGPHCFCVYMSPCLFLLASMMIIVVLSFASFFPQIRHVRPSAANVIAFGVSSGGRLSSMLAIKRPALFRALIVMLAGGGRFAAEHLSQEYYKQYIPVAKGTGGMVAVLNTTHYRNIESLHDVNQDVLGNRDYIQALPVAEFVQTLDASAEQMTNTKDNLMLGISDTQLVELRLPILVIHHNNSYRLAGKPTQCFPVSAKLKCSPDKLHLKNNSQRLVTLLHKNGNAHAELKLLPWFKGYSAATKTFIDNI